MRSLSQTWRHTSIRRQNPTFVFGGGERESEFGAGELFFEGGVEFSAEVALEEVKRRLVGTEVNGLKLAKSLLHGCGDGRGYRVPEFGAHLFELRSQIPDQVESKLLFAGRLPRPCARRT